MLGLLVMVVFGLYVALVVWAVRAAARWARARGRSPRRWGAAAGLALYLVVFWDHLPTLLVHRYYCATRAGTWSYKTPEAWRAENPGVAETLTWQEHSPSFKNADGSFGYRLNERFISETRQWRHPVLPITVTDDRIIDTGTGEVMFKRTRVGSGYGTFPVGGEDWRVLKFWVKAGSCVPREFGRVEEQFERIGGNRGNERGDG